MEIEFRGIRVDNGEMVFGDLCHGLNDLIYINTVVKLSEKSKCNQQIQVIPETVGQYTGLKDKNGVKIYRGDIFTHNGKNFVCNWSERFGYCFVEINSQLVNFHIDGIVMRKQNVRYYADIISYLKYIEVIGNIHQNKELLK